MAYAQVDAVGFTARIISAMSTMTYLPGTAAQLQADHLTLLHGDETALVPVGHSNLRLRVPTSMRVEGEVTPKSYTTPVQPVHIAMVFRLNVDHYAMVSQSVNVPHTEPQGPHDIDASAVAGMGWSELRKRCVPDVGIVMIGHDGTEHDVTMDHPQITDAHRVAILWHRARLTLADPNVAISEWLGCSRNASAARLQRARRDGLVPPARHGQRKVWPTTTDV